MFTEMPKGGDAKWDLQVKDLIGREICDFFTLLKANKTLKKLKLHVSPLPFQLNTLCSRFQRRIQK